MQLRKVEMFFIFPIYLLHDCTTTSCAFPGSTVGTIISFPLSGVLCQYGFDGGWPSIFYIFGNWVILYLCTMHSTLSHNVSAILYEHVLLS